MEMTVEPRIDTGQATPLFQQFFLDFMTLDSPFAAVTNELRGSDSTFKIFGNFYAPVILGAKYPRMRCYNIPETVQTGMPMTACALQAFLAFRIRQDRLAFLQAPILNRFLRAQETDFFHGELHLEGTVAPDNLSSSNSHRKNSASKGQNVYLRVLRL